MAKLVLGTLLAATLSTFTLVTLSSSNVDAGKPCARKKFDTTFVKDSCTAGGLNQAKADMKKWMKDAKKQKKDLACATCHSKVAGDYPLKPDGLKLYKDLGGK